MTHIQEIKMTLKRIVELLRLGGDDDWANAFERSQKEIDNFPEDTKRNILGS